MIGCFKIKKASQTNIEKWNQTIDIGDKEEMKEGEGDRKQS